MNNQTTDFKWFVDNRAELFTLYGDTFLAIKNQQIIGTFSSYAEGVKRVSLTEKLGTFIIQHCTQDESGYTNHIYSMNY